MADRIELIKAAQRRRAQFEGKPVDPLRTPEEAKAARKAYDAEHRPGKRPGESAIAGPQVPRSGRLGKREMAEYIKTQLGDGQELADFYIAVFRAEPGSAGSGQGVWLSHRLAAAEWLAERGWGKPKQIGDGDKAGLTIVVTDYAKVEIVQPPRPQLVVDMEEAQFKGPVKHTEQTQIGTEEHTDSRPPAEEEVNRAPVKVEVMDENFKTVEIEV